MSYADEVGARLRALRNERGWSLAEVERRSGGEWNAAVVGAYERGDRTISVGRLRSLAALYDARPGDVLPGGERQEIEARRPALVLDLAALEAEGVDEDESWSGVRRYVASIRAQRGDAGDQLTVRSEDVLAIAASEKLSADELRVSLVDSGLARPA